MKVSLKARQTHHHAAFTLVELMIVVTVIGLLAAIALPNMSKARDNVRLNHIYRNLRQLDAAKDQWALDNRKNNGTVISDIGDLKDYLRGGQLHDAIHEAYVLNPIGTPPDATLPAGVALGPFPAGGIIPAP